MIVRKATCFYVPCMMIASRIIFARQGVVVFGFTLTKIQLIRRNNIYGAVTNFICRRSISSTASSSSADVESYTNNDNTKDDDDNNYDHNIPPWNRPDLKDIVNKKKRNNKTRFRQHVNPLSRQYQMATILPEDWPHFIDNTKPLHLDIGCGKGGFLIELCQKENKQYNFLGLEIRPGVALYAKERVTIHKLDGYVDFIGCNVNIDLDRLLKLCFDKGIILHRTTIQFPDPHFKTQHNKRRIINQKLIYTLAKYMPYNAIVFLQSDIQSVLDDMRERFHVYGNKYFVDSLNNNGMTEYLPTNILGVPTEREISVLKQNLPVYRVLFTRNNTPYNTDDDEQNNDQD